jgi:hypothetical protein
MTTILVQTLWCGLGHHTNMISSVVIIYYGTFNCYHPECFTDFESGMCLVAKNLCNNILRQRVENMLVPPNRFVQMYCGQFQ